MNSPEKKLIKVQVDVNASVNKVWEMFTTPDHITKWNYAIPEWHSPKASLDLKEKGRFNYRMEAKDGSVGFDFTGTFTSVKPNEYIEYVLDDNRFVKITFRNVGNKTQVTEEFEPENQNPVEMQRGGWQAILNNFKSYVESH
jgi:uncharacterized protein YndB with AHSA1/START domain